MITERQTEVLLKLKEVGIVRDFNSYESSKGNVLFKTARGNAIEFYTMKSLTMEGNSEWMRIIYMNNRKATAMDADNGLFPSVGFTLDELEIDRFDAFSICADRRFYWHV